LLRRPPGGRVGPAGQRGAEAAPGDHRAVAGSAMSEWLSQVVSPGLNATLNGVSGLLLVVGYVAIKRGLIAAHKAFMLAALAVSALFLASYLYYHLVMGAGATRFAERNPAAPAAVSYLYYALLGTHTLLAAAVAPLALVTAYLGLRDRLKGHVRIAR